MANRRVEQTGYQRFEAQANVGDGLLSVARDGGDLERRVAMGLARMADEFGRKADRQAAHAGMLAGRRDALAGAPEPDTVTGGQITGVKTTGGAGGGPVRVSVPPSDLRKMIADAAVRHGVDPHALVTTAGIESSFNPRAKNPNSSAGGLFQFVDGTARQYGLADRFDPAQASDAAARLMRDNAGHLRKALGREPNAGELYLAHQQGAGGASRLLANPNARAVDIVGADAVRLNGGDASMTAGQFAAKWTSKAGGGGYNKLPSASSVGPISVTPVREPVTIEPGKAGTWRPSGEDTVYGRAYDVSGTRTYLEMIDLAMEENQAAIFEAYKDDPAQLEKALGEGLTADLRDNVFEEIAPDYTVAYRKRATGLMGKARAAQREREEQKNRVDFMDRMEGFTNRQSQLISGYDPNDPNAGQSIVDMQATIDAHWDSAAARGIVTPEAARQFKEASREDTMTGYYLAQMKGKSAEDIAATHAKMKADYDAGKLAGVSASAWEKIETGAASAASQSKTRDENANRAFQQRGDEMVKKISRGQPVSAGDMARFQLDAGSTPKGEEIFQSTMARSRVADALVKLPISQVEARLEQILKGGGETIRPEDLDYARELIGTHRKELQNDPLGKAEAIGLIPPVASIPLDGSADVEQIRQAVAYRKGAAESVAGHFGVPVRYFRPGEADAVMAAAVENPDALVVFTQSVTDAFGRDAGKALAEFSESGPALAHASGLAIGTGDIGIARDVAAAMAAKQRNELPKLTPEVNRSVNGFGAAALSGAFLADTKTQTAALQTAQLLFEQEAQRRGIDPAEIKTDNSPAQALYLRTLDRALGGRVIDGVEYGGISEARGRKIIVPPDMRKDEPEELISNLSVKQLSALPPIADTNGFPITASVLRRGVLVSAGDGIYTVALGDPEGDAPRWVMNENRQPWKLDIRQLREISKTVKGDAFGGVNPIGWNVPVGPKVSP